MYAYALLIFTFKRSYIKYAVQLSHIFSLSAFVS